MDQIDVTPILKGWGFTYQGGLADMMHYHNITDPKVVVSMIGPAPDVVDPMGMWVDIPDTPQGCLPDAYLMALTRNTIAWLACGANVVIHCFAGVSRSSYLDVAVHMMALKIGYDTALSIVRARHPQAQPNPGFEAQLRRLEPMLRMSSQ